MVKQISHAAEVIGKTHQQRCFVVSACGNVRASGDQESDRDNFGKAFGEDIKRALLCFNHFVGDLEPEGRVDIHVLEQPISSEGEHSRSVSAAFQLRFNYVSAAFQLRFSYVSAHLRGGG